MRSILHSHIKKRTEKSIKTPITFQKSDPVLLANRNYGLMKTEKRLSTPYPKLYKGIDAATLKARLVDQKRLSVRSSAVTTEPVFDQSQLPKDQSSKRSSKFGISTPHPSRGTTLDHKELISQLSMEKKSPSRVHMGLVTTKNTDEGKFLIGTPHPSKGVALNVKDLEKKVSVLSQMEEKRNTPILKRPKKVQLITPQSSDESLEIDNREATSVISTSTASTGNSYLTISSSDLAVGSNRDEQKLSFKERVRLFDNAEFTIAKNGRKMSDFMMARCDPPMEYIDESKSATQLAKAAIEKYLNLQGYIRTPSHASHQFSVPVHRFARSVSRFSLQDHDQLQTTSTSKIKITNYSQNQNDKSPTKSPRAKSTISFNTQ